MADPMKPTNGVDDQTDGREKYDWVTHYPEAQKDIKFERLYLMALFVISLVAIFAIWKGWIFIIGTFSPEQMHLLKKYSYYAASGLFGGVIFSMKYFYRVVARGRWHLDRREWRLLSPYIAMGIALVVGWMIDASFVKNKNPLTTPAIVSIGFMAGYFADEAVGKMYEIATAIFGRQQH